MSVDFVECDTCRAKPGSPVLCSGCLNNRRVIEDLKVQIVHLDHIPGVRPSRRRSLSARTTDRERAIYHLLGLLWTLGDHAKDLDGLKEVVGKAQNGPPLGAADGTFADKDWTAARDVEFHLRRAIARAQAVTGLGPERS